MGELQGGESWYMRTFRISLWTITLVTLSILEFEPSIDIFMSYAVLLHLLRWGEVRGKGFIGGGQLF